MVVDENVVADRKIRARRVRREFWHSRQCPDIFLVDGVHVCKIAHLLLQDVVERH